MALHVKLHEKFSAPLNPDYWITDKMQGVVVSGGYARVPTTQNPAVYVQPQWFKPDWSHLALYGKRGVNWGEIEFEVKITPRHQRQSGATNTNQMNAYIRNYPIDDGSFRYIATAMWSRTGTGTGTEFGLRFHSSADPDAILYEHTNVPVNTPIWLRLYLNKETGRVRFSTSNNGTHWIERYSAIEPHHITDGDATGYLTPASGDANKYYDIDDFIIRTSNAEVYPNNARVESSVSEIELSVTHHLEVDSSSSSTSSSSPVPSPELDVADTIIDHEAQDIHVSGAAFLGVHSAYHALQSANTALTQLHRLGTQGSLHGLYSGEPGITESRLLAIQSSLHSIKSLAGRLYQNHTATPQGASHSLVDSDTLLKQWHVLSILNGNHSTKSTGQLDLIHSTLLGKPNDASHKLLSPRFGLSQHQILELPNAYHRSKDERARVLNLTRMGLGSGQYKNTRSGAGDLRYLANYAFESEDEIFIFEDEQGYNVLVPEYQSRTLLHRKTYKPSGVLGVIIDTLFESEDSMFYFESEDEKVLLGPEEGKAPQAFKKNYKQKGTF